MSKYCKWLFGGPKLVFTTNHSIAEIVSILNENVDTPTGLSFFFGYWIDTDSKIVGEVANNKFSFRQRSMKRGNHPCFQGEITQSQDKTIIEGSFQTDPFAKCIGALIIGILFIFLTILTIVFLIDFFENNSNLAPFFTTVVFNIPLVLFIMYGKAAKKKDVLLYTSFFKSAINAEQIEHQD